MSFIATAIALAIASADPQPPTPQQPQVAAEQQATTPGLAELVVNVGPLRNMRGFLGCRLYTSAAGFPKEGAQAKAQQRHKPTGNYVTCKFSGLAPGTYAVSVLHDESGDGEMDTNFLGMPEEGYGASNNNLPSMSAPSFDDAKLTVASGETKKISVTLKY